MKKTKKAAAPAAVASRTPYAFIVTARSPKAIDKERARARNAELVRGSPRFQQGDKR